VKRTTLLLIFILFCTFYQDFPLVNVFGEIARTPIFLLVVPMLIYIFSHKNIVVSKYTKYFIYFIVYLFAISAIHLVYIIIFNQKIDFLNQNIITKTIKMSIYPIVALIYYQFIYTYLKNGLEKLNALFNAVFFLQIFFSIFLIFEVYFLKTETIFLPFLHSLPEKFWRVRLLTMEESYVGNVITFFVFIPVFLVNFLKKEKEIKRRVYFLSILIFFIYTFVSESKGYLLLLLISVLPMVINRLYQDPVLKKYFTIILPLLLVCSIFPIIVLQSIFIEELHSSITFGTRFTSYYSSIKVFLKHPFGVGWSGFVYFYPDEIRNLLDSSLVNGLNLSEIKGYMGTTKNLSTKTEFFDGLIYGGIGFIYFYYLFFIKKYKEISKIQNPVFFTLKVPLLFFILAGLTYINYTIKYEVWFLLAFIDVIQNKYNNGSQENFSRI
jgi:hypothetical protein